MAGIFGYISYLWVKAIPDFPCMDMGFMMSNKK